MFLKHALPVIYWLKIEQVAFIHHLSINRLSLIFFFYPDQSLYYPMLQLSTSTIVWRIQNTFSALRIRDDFRNAAFWRLKSHSTLIACSHSWPSSSWFLWKYLSWFQVMKEFDVRMLLLCRKDRLYSETNVCLLAREHRQNKILHGYFGLSSRIFFPRSELLLKNMIIMSENDCSMANVSSVDSTIKNNHL